MFPSLAGEISFLILKSQFQFILFSSFFLVKITMCYPFLSVTATIFAFLLKNGPNKFVVPPAANHLLRRERRAGTGCTSSSRAPRTSTASRMGEMLHKNGKFTTTNMLV
jgi:hypothetical protein